MPVVLKVKVGNGFRDLCVLKPGKTQTIGRLDHCDLAFPEDIEMSGQHLSISLNPDNSCSFSDPGSTNGSFVNERPVSAGVLRPGEILRCGLTEFCVQHVEDASDAKPGPGSIAPSHVHPAPAAHVHAAAAPPHKKTDATRTQPSGGGNTDDAILPETSGFTGTSAAEIFEKYSLGKDIKLAPTKDESPAEYARRLSASCEKNECLIFLSYALPKRCAVWWLTQCTRAAESFKSEADRPMLLLAENWVREPTDENRRNAMKMAEELEMASPAAWAGVAAFWSHGSMGPPEAPPVPAADQFSGKAVSGGAAIASVLHTPENAPERRRQFTEIGVRIAAGQLPWQ
jgi:hypothetical protein